MSIGFWRRFLDFFLDFMVAFACSRTLLSG